MSWVTIIWSMTASACLTLAAVNLLVWCKKRTEWTNLLFSMTAVGTAGMAFCELWMTRAETPGQFGTALRWLHVPAWALLVALVGFVRLYLRAGRPWLAWGFVGLRTLSLLLDFLVGQNLNYREITRLRRIPFLGESVSVAQGVANPCMLVGQFSLLLLVIFVADATVKACASRLPDCLLLDLHMPDINGFEVLERLDAQHLRVPVVVITGHDQPGNAERVRALGALDYLLKPLNESQLLAAIRKVMKTVQQP